MGKTLHEVIDQLTGIDDIFFFKLAEDKGFCEELLQVVLENKELKIVEHKPQAVLRNIKGRSVTLDLKCVDEKGTVFGVEIQKRDSDNHQKRVRYNMANLDTAESEKGVKFDELKDIYEIYISKFDVFGKDRTIYHIDRMIRETQEIVDNGTHEIYVNTKIDDGTEIAEYMQILKKSALPDNPKFPRLCEAFRNIKTGMGDDVMCDLVQEYAEEYANKEKLKMLVELYKDGTLSVEAAAKKLEITDEKFLGYVEEYADR
ncbi:MAG TPA: hypothetical protein DDY31_05140 [Lachnospiraceae bacterium]|nr:hypothetical protein [Lachnospiraceae bacterium]